MPALKQEGSELAIQATADGRVDVIWGLDGNPIFDDTQEFRVTGLLVERRGEWAFDESGQRGSRLHTLQNDQERTRGQLQAYVTEALQPALAGKYIRGLQVVAQRLPRRLYQAVASWVAGGKRVEKRYEFEV